MNSKFTVKLRRVEGGEAKWIIVLSHVEHSRISQLAGMLRFTFWKVAKYDFVTRSIFSYFRQTWLSGSREEMLGNTIYQTGVSSAKGNRIWEILTASKSVAGSNVYFNKYW